MNRWCHGCPVTPVTPLDWFKSPCICTVAAEPETVEGAQATQQTTTASSGKTTTNNAAK
jgi:hypothetical protein